MARMLPPTIPADHPSGAERRLFAKLRDELSGEWTVLHSLGMTDHPRKPWAEIDFVLVGPPGVFCLEVKGGLISREEGRWYTTPIGGGVQRERRRLQESPFQQVGSATPQLFQFLRTRVPRIEGSVTGYAVAFPDCKWEGNWPDAEAALIYDDLDGLASCDAFTERIGRYWAAKVHKGHKSQMLGRKDKAEIVEALRGDFHLVPSMRATIADSDAELVRLTEEQVGLFTRLAANDRVLVRGGAGTGKTLLAVAEARRLAAEGAHVLLTCFSRNLALHLQDVLADTPSVTVRSLHSLMGEIVRDAGRQGELPDADPADLFGVFLPDVAATSLLERDGPMFDALVVDEGQDLLADVHLDILDLAVDGGLERGVWRWFMDPNQDIFAGVTPSGVRRLRDAAPSEWPLTVNCRNTKPIAVQVSLLSGVPQCETLRSDGPAADYLYYEDPDDQRDLVADKVRELIHNVVEPNRIAILSRRRLDRSGVRDGLPGNLPELYDVSRGHFRDVPGNAIRFSTVASFKGLEADVVFLIDVDELLTPEALASLYVGASRARLMLFVAVDKGQIGAFGERGRIYGEMFAELEEPKA